MLLKIIGLFLEYRLFYRALLQTRPIILRGLLIAATPYVCQKEPAKETLHDTLHGTSGSWVQLTERCRVSSLALTHGALLRMYMCMSMCVCVYLYLRVRDRGFVCLSRRYVLISFHLCFIFPPCLSPPLPSP